MKQLSYEQEVNVLAFIEYCQGHSMRGDCRQHMYDIYQLFKNDGRNSSVCTCLDSDTAKKVDNFITSYTFSDEIRFTDRFHKLLPNLALIKEDAEKPLEEKSTVELDEIDLTKLNKVIKKSTKKAKSVPVKPVKSRKRHGTKKK
jgi:hypothetical protein